MNELLLDGEHLTIKDVVRAARTPSVHVALTPEARHKMERSRAEVQRLLSEGATVYGITTGFGCFQNTVIAPDQVRQLQYNIIVSHATGVGEPLAHDVVRAMLLIRANTLAKGYSGIRPEVVEMLLTLLNADILPVIPSQGSLGASGDLAPLAHASLVLLGLGEAMVGEQRVSGAEALAQAGLQPIVLEAKEGLALTNGTSLLTALAVLALHDAEQLCRAANIITALSMEALAAVPAALDPRIHAVRPHPYQIEVAAFLRGLLEGSDLLYRADDHTQLLPRKVQDAYSLRCVPQVHGAVEDALAYARRVVDIELNSATDNPLILPRHLDQREPFYDAISGGNFHGEPVAFAMDFVKLALTELANMSERRLARLVDAACNDRLLPPFLIADGGLNSGFMIVQYTAAALASENKVLVHPASADTIPTSANQEDHVSMAPIAGRQALAILENVRGVIACEGFAAAQAIDHRRQGANHSLRLGRGTHEAYQLIRQYIPFVEQDVVMDTGIKTIRRLIASEELVRTVEAVLMAQAPISA